MELLHGEGEVRAETITSQMLVVTNHYTKWGCGLSLEAKLSDEGLLNEIVGAPTVHQDDYGGAGNRANQTQRFQGELAHKGIKTNLGRARVVDLGWVGARVNFPYMRVNNFIFLRDQEENPRGTTVASMVHLVAIKTEAPFSAGANFLR